mmetsp:Transcript_6348/g.21377  ORF Transcript_6348/g.21377 Transcript_6348/m.21377 type:complete len:213 (-) Transcript_6348:112-750(-)
MGVAVRMSHMGQKTCPTCPVAPKSTVPHASKKFHVTRSQRSSTYPGASLLRQLRLDLTERPSQAAPPPTLNSTSSMPRLARSSRSRLRMEEAQFELNRSSKWATCATAVPYALGSPSRSLRTTKFGSEVAQPLPPASSSEKACPGHAAYAADAASTTRQARSTGDSMPAPHSSGRSDAYDTGSPLFGLMEKSPPSSVHVWRRPLSMLSAAPL